MSETNDKPANLDFDAVIVGAGIAGLFELNRLREMGLKVRSYDAAGDVGGTWYWNCYPGARVDSQSYIYQYWFSRGPDRMEWDWSRAVSRPAGNRTLPELRCRQARPAQGHPVRHPRDLRPTGTTAGALLDRCVPRTRVIR